MTNQTTALNIASIAGIKDSIHEIFSLIEQNLDIYSHQLDDNKPIGLCRTYFHQLNGLFETLELNKINSITEKIEQLITALLDKRIEPSQATIAMLKQAINALHHYLNELADGMEEDPMRLYPAYRNLMYLLGHEQISALDLFYPDLAATPPLKPALTDATPQQLKASAKQICSEYQTGLVRWLKNIASQDDLTQMRNAVDRTEQLPGPNEQRIFWWVTAGFLDGLSLEDSDIDLPTRKLCGKIEQALRHYAEGALQDTSQLTRELLYQIAQRPSASQRITDIKKAYALRAPTEAKPLKSTTPESQQRCLQALRPILTQAKENWQAFCADYQADLALFLNNMEQLRKQSAELQCNPLDKLIKCIDDTVQSPQLTHAQSQKKSESTAMEIATALLQMESIIENFNQLPADLPKKVEAVCTRLHAIANSNEVLAESSIMPVPKETGDPAHKKKTQTQAVEEALTNLRQIEKTLALFFQTPTKHSTLSAIAPLFKETARIFTLINLNRANHLLHYCQDLTQKFSNFNYTVNQTEQNLLIDGLSNLSFFLEAFKNEQPDSQKIIDSAIAVFESTAQQKTVQTSLAANTLEAEPIFDAPEIAETELKFECSSKPETKIDTDIDAELLSIFLEEADDVLAEIAECIQHCHSDHADIESLTRIRRGYHTLKGSGRMVNLKFLSEAAWMMEKLLNHWLNEKKLATDRLIQLMKDVHPIFSGWCHNLKTSGKTEVQIDALTTLINGFTGPNEERTKGHVATKETVANVQDSSAPHKQKMLVAIGGISIPDDFFATFVTESKQHLATLEKELETLLVAQPAIIHEAITLAAHNLATTSHAVQLNFIADPSSKLEQWLSKFMEDNVPLKESEIQLIQNCILQIGEMLHKVHQQHYPEETDLQLAQFLSQEVTKQMKQGQLQAQELADTANLAKSTNLSKYKLKKTPPFVLSDTTSEHLQTEATADIQDKISPELCQIFLEEANDAIPQINAKLRAWRILPQNEDVRISLLRLLHTLKGSAHMIGAQKLGELIHAMEDEIEQAFSKPVVSNYSIDKVEYQFDQLCEKVEQLHKQETIAQKIDITNDVVTANESEIEALTQIAKPGSTVATESTPPTLLSDSPSSIPTAVETVAKPEETSQQPSNILRVNADLIDQLVNESDESNIIRTKIESHLNHFKHALHDLTESIDHLHAQLREIEIQAETQIQSHTTQQQQDCESPFDSLEFDRFTDLQELTRLMAESVDDVITVQKNLSATHSATVKAVAQQAKINHQLHQALVRIRTVSFDSISERYYRVVRKITSELNKKANLTINGKDIEIDRSLLEKISASLEHILRNAVAHGIESPNQRIFSDKPETGQIVMDLQQKDNETAITISDDGRGLDLENIRDKAIKLNLIDEKEHLDDEQIAALIFSPGLTTCDHVTNTAGRGVGMDIVQHDISRLGGQIRVSTQRNKGTLFHIQLPLTPRSAKTLLVCSGNQTYAIPARIIESTREISPGTLQAAYQNHQIDFNGNIYPFTHLSFLLKQMERQPEAKNHNHILLLQNNDTRLAIHIDELVDSREIMIKNTGPQMMHAPGIEGATVTYEGRPVLILNPLKLLKRSDIQQILKRPVLDLVAQPSQQQNFVATILIVDDSLTVRKATSRLLEREGYQVFTAKQGFEAIETLKEIQPDVILVDLEMPKMNGLELIRQIRDNPGFAQTPIIVISSRTADKHCEMANQSGANMFLGKPYKQDELLEHIRHYVKV